MKQIVISILLMGSTGIAGITEPCLPCPNGTKEIVLQLTPKDLDSSILSMGSVSRFLLKMAAKTDHSFAYNYLQSDLIKKRGKDFLKQDMPKAVAVEVGTVNDMREIILDQAKSCQRIKAISISTHGAPGVIGLAGKNDLATKEVLGQLGDLSCAMAPDATIDAYTCFTGSGCEGEVFFRAIAATLLKKGGKIIANNSSSSGLPFILPTTGMNFQKQILTVGDGLQNPKWNHGPTNCSDHFEKQARHLEGIKNSPANKICPEKLTGEDLQLIDAAIKYIREAANKTIFLNNNGQFNIEDLRQSSDVVGVAEYAYGEATEAFRRVAESCGKYGYPPVSINPNNGSK